MNDNITPNDRKPSGEPYIEWIQQTLDRQGIAAVALHVVAILVMVAVLIWLLQTYEPIEIQDPLATLLATKTIEEIRFQFDLGFIAFEVSPAFNQFMLYHGEISELMIRYFFCFTPCFLVHVAIVQVLFEFRLLLMLAQNHVARAHQSNPHGANSRGQRSRTTGNADDVTAVLARNGQIIAKNHIKKGGGEDGR